jgi:hypothetical protein
MARPPATGVEMMPVRRYAGIFVIVPASANPPTVVRLNY